MLKVLIASIVVLIIGGCSSLVIQSDHDKEFSFSSLSSFSVQYTKKDDSKDLIRKRVDRTLISFFEDKGYKSTTKEEADFYILFHLNIKKISEVVTNYDSMMIHPRAYYLKTNHILNPLMKPYMFLPFQDDRTRVSTYTYEYEKGELIIELFDTKSNTIVWQSIAKDVVSDISSQEQIKKIVEDMFKDFPSK